MTDEIRVGALGAGGFGLFALNQFRKVPGVSVTAIADIRGAAAKAASQRFGAAIVEVDDLVRREDVDLVYIATPPFLHHPQGMAALESGKHVICEKPLAVTVGQADEMIGLARDRGLVMVADFMQRYNPIYAAIKELISRRLLGEPLHGYFENYASDEHLRPGHWFWDRQKSGGIFIEHGVHFFDVFDGWLGPGKVVAAQKVLRPGSGLEEQVGCTVRHPGDVLVNHYHSFTQPSRMDRQELRLVFELGDVTLYGWVPLSARVRALVDEDGLSRMLELFPGAEIERTEDDGAGRETVTGRHKTSDAREMIGLGWDGGRHKLDLYGELVASLLSDQVDWIRDKTHARVITEINGRASLALAVQATELTDRTP